MILKENYVSVQALLTELVKDFQGLPITPGLDDAATLPVPGIGEQKPRRILEVRNAISMTCCGDNIMIPDSISSIFPYGISVRMCADSPPYFSLSSYPTYRYFVKFNKGEVWVLLFFFIEL